MLALKIVEELGVDLGPKCPCFSRKMRFAHSGNVVKLRRLEDRLSVSSRYFESHLSVYPCSVETENAPSPTGVPPGTPEGQGRNVAVQNVMSTIPK